MVKIHTTVLAASAGFPSLFLFLQAEPADTLDERHLMSLLRSDFSLNWTHPGDLSGTEAERKAVVHFHILKDASISGLKVITSSTSPQFDKVACNAVLESAPILLLPISLSCSGKKEEPINVEFTFDSLNGNLPLPELVLQKHTLDWAAPMKLRAEMSWLLQNTS